jgi:hypothetical protein
VALSLIWDPIRLTNVLKYINMVSDGFNSLRYIKFFKNTKRILEGETRLIRIVHLKAFIFK